MESGNTRPQLPSDDADERVIETIVCVEERDKDGRTLRRFCVSVPGEYTSGSGTPKPDSTGGDSSPPDQQGEA